MAVSTRNRRIKTCNLPTQPPFSDTYEDKDVAQSMPDSGEMVGVCYSLPRHRVERTPSAASSGISYSSSSSSLMAIYVQAHRLLRARSAASRRHASKKEMKRSATIHAITILASGWLWRHGFVHAHSAVEI